MLKLFGVVSLAALFVGTLIGSAVDAATVPPYYTQTYGNNITAHVAYGADVAAGELHAVGSSSTSSIAKPPQQTHATNNGGTLYRGTSQAGTNTGGTQFNETANTYVALGDSVAAGLGLSGSTGGCGRTAQAYPTIVAEQRSLSLVHAACSGATTTDVLNSQLDMAFANGTPQLITITVGANDAHWLQLLRLCYAAKCDNAVTARLTSSLLSRAGSNMRAIFDQIQSRSNGRPPEVIVTGYYNPVSQGCKDKQSRLTNNEIDFIDAQRSNLNQTIRNAAAGFTFVKYASVDFTGHGLCSTQPWAQGLSAPAPLHPTATGQQQYAAAILSVR
jgi:lysophospholipase L1-like esterase